MTVIKDGTGQGYLAGVTEHNRLKSLSLVITAPATSADAGEAFLVDGQTTIVAATEKTVIILVNSGSEELELGRVIISVQNQQPAATGAGTSTVTVVKIYIGNATVTAGGTTKTASNANTGSANQLEATVTTNNPTLGGTDTKVTELYFLADDCQLINYLGDIVVAPGGSFRVTCTGGAGAVGTLLCDVSLQIFTEVY